MNTYIDSKIITLNSEYAVNINSTYNSDVFFNTSGLLKDDYDMVHADIVLLNAQIPISFYNINYTCNVLYYNRGTNKTITMPIGNYTITSFISTLQQSFSTLGDNITITFNQSTGILTFTSASGDFTFYTANTTMFRVIGFDTGTDYTSSGGILLATNPFNLTTITQISISSDTLVTHSYSTNSVANILFTLSVDKSPFNYLIYNLQQNSSRVILRNRSIDAISIKLKDEYGNFINFNNQEWNMTLCLNVERNYLAIPRLLNDYLKTQSLGNNKDNTNQENGGNSTDNQDTEIDPELNLLSK